MRKVIAGLAITFDSVVEAPAGNWLLFNDEMAEVIDAGTARSDAILLGRETYLDFAERWPNLGSEVPRRALTAPRRARCCGCPAAAGARPTSRFRGVRADHRGRELEDVLQAIGRWGAGSPLLPDSSTVGVDTFILGLRSQYDPIAGAGVNARYELQVDDESFDFQVADGRLTVQRGNSDRPDAVITIDPSAMAATVRDTRALLTALSAPGRAADEVERFAALFSPSR